MEDDATDVFIVGSALRLKEVFMKVRTTCGLSQSTEDLSPISHS